MEFSDTPNNFAKDTFKSKYPTVLDVVEISEPHVLNVLVDINKVWPAFELWF